MRLTTNPYQRIKDLEDELRQAKRDAACLEIVIRELAASQKAWKDAALHAIGFAAGFAVGLAYLIFRG